MEAFVGFLNDQSLNEQQISFVKRVVNYVVDNGYMEPQALTQPPVRSSEIVCRDVLNAAADGFVNGN